MSRNCSKKKNSFGSGDKKTKPTHHFVHSPDCPKFKQNPINLKKPHFGNDKEVFSIPPESLDRFPKKHHHKKKQQQNNNVNTEIKRDEPNRKFKKRESLKVNDKTKNNTIGGLNKYFSLESNHPKDIKERIRHNNKEIPQKNSDFHIKGYLWNFFDKFKTQNDPKTINVVYSRSPRKETEDIIKRCETREHRNEQIEDMYCDTLKGGVLLKNTRDVMRNKKCKNCISIGVPAKSLYTMDTSSQMSNPKIKCLTEIHHPVIEILPKSRPTSSRTIEKHQDDFKEMSRNASIRQSKIPVSPGRESYRSDNEKKDPTNLRVSTNDGNGFKTTKTEDEIIENINSKTPPFVSRESSSPESLKKSKLPSRKRQQPSSFAFDAISDQLPSKNTTLLLTKTYRQPEKLNLIERQKQYSENLRRKTLKPKVTPQVIELRYLTDLTRRSCSSVDKSTKNWLEENHEHYNDELRKEHLEMLTK